jgi:hypothetical protein
MRCSPVTARRNDDAEGPEGRNGRESAERAAAGQPVWAAEGDEAGREEVSTLIPLEELAGQMGGAPVEVALARLPRRAKTVTDWQGRVCISEEVAARLLKAWDDEVAENLSRQSRYEDYVADHERTRQAAGNAAFEKARRSYLAAEKQQATVEFAAFAGLNTVSDSPYAREAGRQARREALEEFDAKHPLVPFKDWQ